MESARNTRKLPNVPSPFDAPLLKASEQVPVMLRPFVGKTPLQTLQTLLPNAKNLHGTAALFSGLGIELGLPLPDWARADSRKIWEAVGLNIMETSGSRTQPTSANC